MTPLMDPSQVAFLLICLSSVPITQLAAIYVNPHQSSKRRSLIPRMGGTRHVVFTLMSWLTWAVSVGFATPVMSPTSPVEVPPSHIGVLYGAAVSCSVIGLVFNIKALLVLELDHQNRKAKQRQAFFSPTVGFVAVLVLGLVLALMAGFMLAATDHLPDIPSRLLYCFISICSALIAASSTHGLGGFLRHGKSSSSAPGWQFFQPFEGGQVFVASQALGWTLFSVSVVCVLKVMQELLRGVVKAVSWWALGTGSIMIATQLILGLSLLTFNGRSRPHRLREEIVGGIKKWLLDNAPILLMYTPVHIVCAIWVVTFMCFPVVPISTFWALSLVVYYVLTSRGNPMHTGCRRRAAVHAWFVNHLPNSLAHWVGRVDLVYTPNHPLNPRKKYIFGYHPHGLYPGGAGFFPYLPLFREKCPGIEPTTLAASVMFLPPLLRDILSWCGFRHVSRKTFIRALNEDKAIVVCPGGQQELLEAYRVFQNPSEFVVCTRHRGFCRLAIEQRALLVPVLALGEIFTFKNAFDMPNLQKATYRIFGFPIPYLLAGRWGISPLPKNVPLKYIVGPALDPPEIGEDGTIAEELVDKLHEQYFMALVKMYHDHKASHPFYRNTEIVLDSPIKLQKKTD